MAIIILFINKYNNINNMPPPIYDWPLAVGARPGDWRGGRVLGRGAGRGRGMETKDI